MRQRGQGLTLFTAILWLVGILVIIQLWLVAAALDALLGATQKPQATPEARIAAASAVPPGGSLLFRYPTEADPCILVRDEEGRFHGFSQVCTHLSCAVIYRSEEKELFCPCHHGVFDPASGAPLAGPPTRRLPRIRLEQRGDDLYATGVEI